MFVPTIKYKRVDNPPVATATPEKKEETIPIKEEPKVKVEPKTEEQPKTEEPKKGEPKAEPTTAPRAQDEPTIEIDPSDKDRILITLTNGKKYTADRYCPHAGADLTYLGEVAEDEYPPEIGPVLLCTLHYWEFALEKAGRSGGGWATLNACPVPADQCPAETNKKLDW
ncbi:hypothetical protein BJV82DRAFT_557990 [Fennellomyces sp. T-0311]|nr:hypothetical protein BJV82DRAFT_557990 [Fennellomyces sp. T-0311]